MRKILLTLCLLSALLFTLATSSSRTVRADDQFRIEQCLWYECYFYEGYNIPGVGTHPDETVCEWSVKACDWSNPDCLVRVKQ